jgi:thymidylate synthase
MIVLNVRNANDGLFEGLMYLRHNGIWQNSRNGEVIRAPTPVITQYTKPMERVVFSPIRDANPFFHLYESMWMLAGRNDVRAVARYAKQMLEYSDDGSTLHDAYGHRWRKWFGHDQLKTIIRLLKSNPLDRQCVLQMWDSEHDLARAGKAVPCNLIATFTVDPTWDSLDLTVFCRSNDIIWGTYGANAVHFGFLLEYVAVQSGMKPGRYNQISVNYHAYEYQYRKCLQILDKPFLSSYPRVIEMPYEADYLISDILEFADDCSYPHPGGNVARIDHTEWGSMINRVLWAHQLYKGEQYEAALHVLKDAPISDWTQASIEWIIRRRNRAVYAELPSGNTPEGA